ncbi:MAG: high frequency lysogenization protein HflD [Granulosicoccus sp.]
MSSLITTENQTLALAGIFQSVHLCKSLATSGGCEQNELKETLHSVLTLNTDKVLDAYGGSADGVGRGLRVIKSQLGGNAESRDLDLARYALTLMQLGTNIMNDASTVEQLRIDLSRIKAMDLPTNDPAIISNLANLYRNSISHLNPRIMINGNPDYLSNNDIASTIRAALLGGIRSVVLWRQCGGTRPKLLFSKSAYLREADKLLENRTV